MEQSSAQGAREEDCAPLEATVAPAERREPELLQPSPTSLVARQNTRVSRISLSCFDTQAYTANPGLCISYACVLFATLEGMLTPSGSCGIPCSLCTSKPYVSIMTRLPDIPDGLQWSHRSICTTWRSLES